MRVRLPALEGVARRDDVDIAYEVFGEGPQTIVLMPPWAINHSRTWKGQVPYLARHFRVVTYDPPGNGKSSRPQDPAEYTDWKRVADAIAVMDATQTERAIIVGICTEAWTATLRAGEHPQRAIGLVFFAPVSPYGKKLPAREVSGDLYDFFRLPDGRLAFYVGDVSGKGSLAAVTATASWTPASTGLRSLRPARRLPRPGPAQGPEGRPGDRGPDQRPGHQELGDDCQQADPALQAGRRPD